MTTLGAEAGNGKGDALPKRRGPVRLDRPALALYVDDEPLLLEVAKAFLELDPGVAVDVCASAREAMALLPQKDYDVVVSDYQMQEMDGICFLKALRQEGNGVPFVLFTGKGREDVAMEALNNGANFYLQKGGAPTSQFGELRHIIIQLAQRRVTERSLFDRDEKLSLIIKNIRDIITHIDNDGVFQYVSPSVQPITGFRPEDLVGRSAFDLIHPDDLPSVVASVRKSRADKGAIRLEYRSRHADGHYLFLESTGGYFLDDAGNIAGSLVTTRDVTEATKAKLELEETAARLSLIFQNEAVGIAVIHPGTSSFVMANPAYLRFVGYTREELMELGLRGIVHPDDAGRTLENTRLLMEGKMRSFTEEKRYIRKDGAVVWGRVTVSGVYDRSARGIYAIGILEDITDRRAEEEASPGRGLVPGTK